MEGESLKDLYMRRSIAKSFLQILESSKNDPRYKSSKLKYEGQLKVIEDKIAKLEAEPHDVVIGLKPAVLTAKGKNRGE